MITNRKCFIAKIATLSTVNNKYIYFIDDCVMCGRDGVYLIDHLCEGGLGDNIATKLAPFRSALTQSEDENVIIDLVDDCITVDNIPLTTIYTSIKLPIYASLKASKAVTINREGANKVLSCISGMSSVVDCLNYVKFEGDRLTSADGHKLCACTIEGDRAPDMLLRPQLLTAMSKLGYDTFTLCASGGVIVGDGKGMNVYCDPAPRIKYPSADNLINIKTNNEITFVLKDIKKLLKNFTRLSFDEKGVIGDVLSPEYANIQEPCKFDIAVNNIEKVLKACKGNITIKYSKAERNVILTDDSSNCVFVICKELF